MLSRRLARRGFDVCTAVDGGEAITLAQSSKPDLILLDMNLPVMDGWTVAKELKGNDATQDIRIIALTAHAMAGDREKALAAGCDDYHPKPVDFSQLLNQIEGLIGKTEGG